MLEIKMPVSHLTGVYTSILIDAKYTHLHHLTEIFMVLAGYFSGAIFSGFLIGPSRLSLGRKYGLAMISQGLCLSLASGIFHCSVKTSLYLGAFTCGSVNAMAIFYRGIILRTTHITGLITDLGRSIGTLLRGGHVDSWKITLGILLIVAFFAGTFLGLIAELSLGIHANLIPGFMLMGGGLTYYLKRTQVLS